MGAGIIVIIAFFVLLAFTNPHVTESVQETIIGPGDNSSVTRTDQAVETVKEPVTLPFWIILILLIFVFVR
jgi:hypothetical protein